MRAFPLRQRKCRRYDGLLRHCHLPKLLTRTACKVVLNVILLYIIVLDSSLPSYVYLTIIQ